MVRCWAGCDPRAVLAELRRYGLIGSDFLASPSRPIPRGTDPARDRSTRIEAARRILNAARDARASPVATYLGGRSIVIDLPPSLRWAPALPRPDGVRAPAMIARIDDVAGELIGVHRTWLGCGPVGTRRRRDRAMLGRTSGGAVRLAPAAETLLVGEGIETCLAAMQATAQPAWAALRAARAAAARWLAEGRRVRIAMPPGPGSDFNDVVLMGRGHARIMEARDAAA